MKKRKLKNQTLICLIIAVCLSVLRIAIGMSLTYSFRSNDVYDDLLMFQYADFASHYASTGYLDLVKNMSYPLFLNLTWLAGGNYAMLLNFTWILAAVLSWRMVKKFSDNPWLQLFAYAFVLMAPCAFDDWIGLRMYRNSIIAPSLFICFELLALLVWDFWHKNTRLRTTLITAVFAGLSLAFCFYLKEDGMWMVPLIGFLTIALLGACFLYFVRSRRWKKCLTMVLAALIPWGIFQGAQSLTNAVNDAYFGVPAANLRTDGALGQFLSRVYHIESDERSTIVWAPYDAIEKAFDASPTLSALPELKDAVINNEWFPQGDPITGDFLGWVMLTSLKSTGVWESTGQIEDLFEQVNRELDEAFENGTLKKAGGWYLTSSMGSRDFGEAMSLIPQVFTCIQQVLSVPYEPDNLNSNAVDKLAYESAQKKAGITFRTSETDNPEWVLNVVNVINIIYRILLPLLFVAAIFIWFLGLFYMHNHKHKNRPGWVLLACIFVLAGFMFAYAFAICWFFEFFHQGDPDQLLLASKFYGIVLVPMVYLEVILGVTLGSILLKKFRQKMKLSPDLLRSVLLQPAELEKKKKKEPSQKLSSSQPNP